MLHVGGTTRALPRGPACLALAALGAFAEVSAWAAPFPLAPQFQVNTTTTVFQFAPNVGIDGAGNFVVIWQSDRSSGSDSSYRSIQGQRFDSAGMPVGTEFQVNAYTTLQQQLPSLSVGAAGDFVVVWQSDLSSGADSYVSIDGRRFDSAGLPVGADFPINTYTTAAQLAPSVAVDPAGGFVVVWHSNGSGGSDASATSIQGQRFDGSGLALGTEFQVNTYTTSEQYSARVAADSAGNFVVVWSSLGSSSSDSSLHSIQGQRFDAAGLPLGSEFQVNTYTTLGQIAPSVAFDPSGNFVVAWTSLGSSGSDSSDHSIQGQRFDSAGTPVGTEFQVNTYTTSLQLAPRVAVDSAGNFVVAWSTFSFSGSDTSSTATVGQRFDNSGMPLGTEFQVNTYTSGSQSASHVAVGPAGDFVVAWHSFGSSGTDSSYSSIQAQRFSSEPLCGPVPEPDGSCRLADPIGAGRSSLQIRNSSDDLKDRFKWRWNKGVATDLADFKTPTNEGATYRLCIYDAAGGTQPLLEADIPVGPGWTQTGTTGVGYKSAVSSTLSGITAVKLKAGAARKAQVQVKGRGPLLYPPATGALVADVVVQLLIDDGITIECFKTAFPGMSGAGAVTKQDSSEFKAKGP